LLVSKFRIQSILLILEYPTKGGNSGAKIRPPRKASEEVNFFFFFWFFLKKKLFLSDWIARCLSAKAAAVLRVLRLLQSEQIFFFFFFFFIKQSQGRENAEPISHQRFV
jgi:hypothetical protein